MKSMLKNCYVNLIILILLTFLLIFVTNRNILTVGFYENGGDPLSGIPEQGVKVYESLQNWIYFSSAVYLLIKLCLITLIIYTALYLNDQVVPAGKIFTITVLAEYIFLVPATIKTLSFPLLFPNGSLLDWRKYYILSALSIFEEAPADWSYALQTLNVFEVAYWFILAYGIFKVSKLNYDQSLKIVTVAYLPALFIWVTVITFLTLLLFPGMS
ncbi:hypothetical protein [Mucilaginibacter sp. UYCu711]|uniref:hypothetical protein n=1 Tax=Mucilaginibacter sp. UYCu711 TaxID=3156339 RepID=UPI003D1B9F2A